MSLFCSYRGKVVVFLNRTNKAAINLQSSAASPSKLSPFVVLLTSLAFLHIIILSAHHHLVRFHRITLRTFILVTTNINCVHHLFLILKASSYLYRRHLILLCSTTLWQTFRR